MKVQVHDIYIWQRIFSKVTCFEEHFGCPFLSRNRSGFSALWVLGTILRSTINNSASGSACAVCGRVTALHFTLRMRNYRLISEPECQMVLILKRSWGSAVILSVSKVKTCCAGRNSDCSLWNAISTVLLYVLGMDFFFEAYMK